MDKKLQPKTTPDIRNFFSRGPSGLKSNGNSTPNNLPKPVFVKHDNSSPAKKKVVLLSSEDDSPIKKNYTELKRTSQSKSSDIPKRKKAYIESSSESEEEIIRVKKIKNSNNDRPTKNQTTPPKKEIKKRKTIDSDDDFNPIKEKKSPNKEKKSPNKDKKSTKTFKKDEKTTTKSTATNGNSKKDSKSTKLVKPLDHDSADESNGIECKMVKKGQNVVTGFSTTHKNETIQQKSAGDKKNVADEMWVNKYKPTSITKIIGQHTPKSCANKLKFWLDNWMKNKEIKPKYGVKNDTGAGLRAALLSGPPGIGKTTTATLVAKECGYEFVEYNASDTRNKKSMDEHIQTLLNNKTLDGFFSDPTNKTKMTSKHLLIMDEVDGMGGADRGGIAELIQFIKKTQIPIICICNDRNSAKIRNLANYCFDLRFSKPRTEQIKSMILSICAKEGVKVDNNLISEIIEMSNHDIRQVIHYFSVFATKNKNLNDVKNHKIIKDVTLGPFDAVKRMFTSSPEYDQMTFNEKSNLFFNDYQLMPLFAWENYIISKPSKSKTGVDTLALATKSIDAICIGDLMETQIRTNQNWSLLPFQAVFSTVMPGYYMNGHFSEMIQFPSILGKISSFGKKDRLIQELKQHMNLKISGSKTCLNLDYLVPLRDKILNPLIHQEDDAVNKSIETLNHYNLLKDDLDSIIECSLWKDEKSPFAKVDSKTKAALTRTYNKNAQSLPYANKDMITKVGKGASKSKSKKDSEFKSDDEGDDKEDEIADDDLLPEF